MTDITEPEKSPYTVLSVERERKEEARDAKAARGPKWFRKRRG